MEDEASVSKVEMARDPSGGKVSGAAQRLVAYLDSQGLDPVAGLEQVPKQ